VKRAAPWAIAVLLVGLVLGLRPLWSPDPLDNLAASPAQSGDPPGTSAHTGSLHLARGGPFVLGFSSPGPAVLAIDGQRLITGRGVSTARIVLDAGAVGFRFAAPPGAKLVWHPPGRRGDPEYVPASSLSPSPPASARFDHPGTARGDAVAAWLLVAIVVGLALWLSRKHLAAQPRELLLCGLAIFALAALVRLWDLGAAGQTWDEDTYWSAGRNYLQNVVRLDFADDAWRWNYEHPPVTKYLAGLGGLWSDGFGGARAVSALVLALGCALLVPIGARLVDVKVGVVAGAVAALSPHLIAHGQIVGHESPSVAIWALAWWASLRVWDRGDGRAIVLRRLALVGVILGVALMIRFVNGLAAPALGLTIVLTAPPTARNRAVRYGLAVIPVVAVVTSVVLWPRLWTHPIAHLAESWAKLKGTHSGEPFLGTITDTPPRWYFLAYLGATSPVGVLISAVIGAIALAATRQRALLIAAIWLVAPLGVALSPVRQDGVRYVLPMLVPLAFLAAVGALALARLVARRASVVVAAIVPAALVGYLIVVCVRIQPYYLDYYGEQVGGTAAVAQARRFEVAWWGEGVAEAIDYVNRHAGPGARVHRRCVEPSHLTWFRGDLWEPVDDPGQAAWIVHYQPSWRPCPIPPDAVRVYRVSAGGAPLADVYRRGAP